MILLHDVLHLVQVLFGELVTVLKNRPDLVVDHVERVEVLLLKVTLLRFINQQGNFVGYLFIILYADLDPPVVHVDHFHQLEGKLAIFALEPWSDVLVLTVLTDLLLLEVPVGLGGVDHCASLELFPTHTGHFLLLIFLLVQIVVKILVVEPDCLKRAVARVHSNSVFVH